MHIPDGFLSTPVWLALDAAGLPAIGYAARKAQAGMEETRIPLLGVMGAFVFAAQMINFPVGVGTSGHLIGSALLAITLGPAAAAVVMSAVLIIQALIFQDGGVLSLGANVFNMAICGVIAGYLPFHLWGSGRYRNAAIFLSGFASAITSALLAIAELSASGVAIPGPILLMSLGFFALSAVLEGAITVAVIQGIQALRPGAIRKRSSSPRLVPVAVALCAVLLASVGVLFASASPDGLEKLAEHLGVASQAKTLFTTPFADYEAAMFRSEWLSKAGAGILGLGVVYAGCLLFGRLATRRRSA